MKLRKTPCPCGCKKFMVQPLLNSVESTLHEEEADELIRRWNTFEPLEAEATTPSCECPKGICAVRVALGGRSCRMTSALVPLVGTAPGSSEPG
jgi:hypothetical protein